MSERESNFGNLANELRKWLDEQDITPDTIGNIRRRCSMPWDGAWNALVRDETAARELPNDIWKDPEVKAALKEGRSADDIAVLSCPKCSRWGYYNQGSRFHCRFCRQGFACLSEGELPPVDATPYLYLDGFTTLADTVTEPTDGYHNETTNQTT